MRLAVLAARRVLPLVLWIAVPALFLWVRGEELAPRRPDPAQLLVVPAAADDRLALAWSAALVLFLGTLAYRSAGLARRWRESESDWLAPRPIARSRLAAISLAGIAAGAALFLGATSLSARLATSSPAPRYAALEIARTPPALLAPGETAHRRVELSATGASFLRLELDVLPATDTRPVADVEARLSRGSNRGAPTRVRAFGHTLLDVEVPGGDGPLELELVAGPTPLVLREELTAVGLAPRVPLGATALHLATHALGLALLLSALALGLGTRLRPSLATLLLFSLGLTSLASGRGPVFELCAALAHVGVGLTPMGPSALSLAFVPLGVAVGVATTARGLVPWRDA